MILVNVSRIVQILASFCFTGVGTRMFRINQNVCHAVVLSDLFFEVEMGQIAQGAYEKPSTGLRDGTGWWWCTSSSDVCNLGIGIDNLLNKHRQLRA